MRIKELLEKQKLLDDYILKNITIDEKTRLTNTTLAMIVEVAEMANEIRSFKHWSKKAPSDKETILSEYVDVLHFFLSIANQLGFSEEDIERAYNAKNKVNFERQNTGY